jgi:hypothetical protein
MFARIKADIGDAVLNEALGLEVQSKCIRLRWKYIETDVKNQPNSNAYVRGKSQCVSEELSSQVRENGTEHSWEDGIKEDPAPHPVLRLP